MPRAGAIIFSGLIGKLDICQDLAKVLHVLCPNALFVGSLSGEDGLAYSGVWRARRPQGEPCRELFSASLHFCPYRGP